MRLCDLELRKERLPRLARAPVIAVVKRLRVVHEVVVRLRFGDLAAVAHRVWRRGIRHKPARLPQQCGQRLVGRWQRLRILHVMRMQARGGLVGAEDEGRARGAAHRRGGVSSVVAPPFRREPVKMRRLHLRQAIGAGVRGHIIRDDPDEVRRRGNGRLCGQQQKP